MAGHDPIADMLTAIRNASFAKKDIVEVKRSKLAEEMMKIFKSKGFISNYRLIKDSRQGVLRIHLKYAKDHTPAILGIRRISKPSLRIYKKSDELPKVYGGLGTSVISTSKGLMTDEEAGQRNLGGEVICYIW